MQTQTQPLPQIDTPLAIGASSQQIKKLQALLVRWDFSPGSVDGVIGPKTIQAVKEAFGVMARSPSEDARTLAAPGPSAYPLVGDLYNAIWIGLEANAVAIQGGAAGPTPQGVAAEPTTNVSMDPVEAAKIEARLTGGIGWPWWKWGLAALGVGAVGIVGYKLIAGKRSR